MKEFVEEGDPDQTIGIKSISLGDALRFVALDAEPVVEYRGIVESVFPNERLIALGYTDQVFGYLPVDGMLSEGGYEVSTFRQSFEFKGRYRTGIDRSVRGALARLNRSTTAPESPQALSIGSDG